MVHYLGLSSSTCWKFLTVHMSSVLEPTLKNDLEWKYAYTIIVMVRMKDLATWDCRIEMQLKMKATTNLIFESPCVESDTSYKYSFQVFSN